MKLLLTLGTLALLVAGCTHETTMTEDTGLLDMYNTVEDTEGMGSEDNENTIKDPEEEPVTSVGPTTIPDDLIPSR